MWIIGIPANTFFNGFLLESNVDVCKFPRHNFFLRNPRLPFIKKNIFDYKKTFTFLFKSNSLTFGHNNNFNFLSSNFPQMFSFGTSSLREFINLSIFQNKKSIQSVIKKINFYK